MRESKELALKVRHLEKAYNVPVLTQFDFELKRGETHALVGSNGAGKSTFARILTGLTHRNAGSIELKGKPFSPASKQEASARGVNMALQELNIIPTLTIAENLFLHDLPASAGIVDRHALENAARVALERVGLDSLDPGALARSLGMGQQQLVEIAGVLAQESSVLILDEPTAALTGPEIDLLFENIDRLCLQGVAVIYISHRMDEIFRIADRVTVLRDGKRIDTHDTRDVPIGQLVKEMAGNELAERRPHVPKEHRGVGLRVNALRSGNSVRGVSFQAHKGEILGIAGLVGSGRTETLRAIFGADQAQSGSIEIGETGEAQRLQSPSQAVSQGIGLVPEDRKQEGLLLDKAISVNATLSTLAKHSRLGIINHRSELMAVAEACSQLALKCHSLEQNVGELSGGNQQKVVIARLLLRDCQVLLCDEPTRGIDVAAKETIYDCLDRLAEKGKTVIVVSSDLLELMTISHRIIVMSAGKIAGEFFPETWTQEAITAAAFSGYTERLDVA